MPPIIFKILKSVVNNLYSSPSIEANTSFITLNNAREILSIYNKTHKFNALTELQISLVDKIKLINELLIN